MAENVCLGGHRSESEVKRGLEGREEEMTERTPQGRAGCQKVDAALGRGPASWGDRHVQRSWGCRERPRVSLCGWGGEGRRAGGSRHGSVGRGLTLWATELPSEWVLVCFSLLKLSSVPFCCGSLSPLPVWSPSQNDVCNPPQDYEGILCVRVCAHAHARL